ncbi:hypothetical protein Tco_1117802 [Tanacetum coccineum]
MVPKAVLMRSGLVSLTTARPVNTAQPRTTVNSARPMTNNVNTAMPKAVVNTARPKAVLNAVKGNQSSTHSERLVYMLHNGRSKSGDGFDPKSDNFLANVQGNPHMDLQDQGVIYSGCSRHMTRNMSYLTDFE